MEIKLKGITKVFPGNPKKHIKDTVAVDDFDLTVPDGDLVGLLGPSGCGKSTTLYMISGLQTPTSGEVWFGEEEVTNLSPEKRGIGLVFQNYALYPHMTIYKNVEFPLLNLRVEVPLVTFFDYNIHYTYTMKEDDHIEGIIRSTKTLMGKIGIEKRNYKITHTLTGSTLDLIVDLKNTNPKNKDLFMLKVSGESMINAAILDGDLIIVQKQSTAMNGDIVVALIDNENATVKTFYKEKDYIRLQPENDTMEPIIVKDVIILGKVVGVFRKL